MQPRVAMRLRQVRVPAGVCSCGVCTADCVGVCLPRDFDNDGDADLRDFALFQRCFTGISPSEPVGEECAVTDSVETHSIELNDFCLFQIGLTGPL